jgi:hypothetical protein
VVLAAGLIAIELAWFRSGSELAGWTTFAQQMLSVHLLVALGEGAAIALVALALARLASPAKAPLLRPALVAAALAILTAFAIPFSSELPDGYEYAAEKCGQASWLK